MSSPQIPKLSIEYFDSAGRADPCRTMLTIAGIPFDDIRRSQDEFKQKKADGAYPLAQLPVLHIDGEMHPQSFAMSRYVGKLTGFYPTDPIEALRVDSILDAAGEVIQFLVRTYLSPPDQAAEFAKKTIEVDYPRLIGYFEKKILAAKEQGSPFICNGKLSVADFELFHGVYHYLTLGIVKELPTEEIMKYTVFIDYIETLKTTEPIKSFLESKSKPSPSA